ncbi:ABC transporter ATP-binding protein [Deinococcus radiodurans]|jgi:amino acid/amide ABC transporter ATP-binding protein 2, HAAT family (TC 3.A.1.4.-)|uniref:Branched-chain amino acid ABC transporter, ATP-binding protein n=1 Tax=Deinococcus radiodurans (strain ATCC 13939 / DSM 20539 / JCM 16871 / CCUG 27074 / LMG 4051 / NBRC 15346 / NCIMB 9279 / VKM B-1422 / R1) TaxID=243230 RepID=Q9RXM6_DEIRA|nr:ABC transporter ATP-binding protein [Deinococcus radiodurans]AAF09866.1 branched-chain amino acid ABC transporter, ATP-binding protein [Deinococcus radiodurans R1 = ATCC 13939 = DSM 20539]ANC72455.1 ABC transporter ATP-binding protein [Deinococcus radiodurans R1 = ATCC 13939 = DSM 20539]QEM72247.1 ABC transporter ATP-binding protein [Deinococcus radiodurans]QIP28491.1 ABC transporter ATP-binding protein [Deinococcus radiodurans]QIP32792.1 ABC transporter ATP-binding protein [Deinococcus rad
MLEVRDLSVKYGNFTALHSINLTVQPGEIVVLLGANGAGKSTLFRTLSGLQRPSGGAATWQGTPLTGGKPEFNVSHGVSQCPEGRLLFPELSVEKNLRLGAYVHRRDAAGNERELEKVYELFPAMVDKRHAPAGSLSGGQQQMVAIGRALMARPSLLLLDEPSLGLAPLVVEQVLAAAQQINAQGVSVLLAEQNAYAALSIAHRGYVLESGQVTLQGTAQELMNDDRVRSAYLGV